MAAALCLVTALEEHVDERGNLIEIVKDKVAQVNMLWIGKGKSRGGHFHKKNGEWFCVVKGLVQFDLNKVDSNCVSKGKSSHVFSGDAPMLVWIPPFVVHTLENKTEESAMVLVAAMVPFSESKDDVFWL